MGKGGDEGKVISKPNKPKQRYATFPHEVKNLNRTLQYKVLKNYLSFSLSLSHTHTHVTSS